MRVVLEDLRYALRVLRRTPALDSGRSVYSGARYCRYHDRLWLIDGMVLHPFHGAIGTTDNSPCFFESVSANGMQNQVSYADFRDFQDSLRSISGLLLNQRAPPQSAREKRPIPRGTKGSPENYFDVLGVKAGPGSRVRSRRIRRPGQSVHGSHQLSVVEELFSCRQVRRR